MSELIYLPTGHWQSQDWDPTCQPPSACGLSSGPFCVPNSGLWGKLRLAELGVQTLNPPHIAAGPSEDTHFPGAPHLQMTQSE